MPAGVDSGSRIRFEAYDVVIDVAADSKFRREGNDIVTELELTYPQVALGVELFVETITGKVKIRIPAGTQPGTLIRLSGRGVPRVRGGGSGDHYVKINVVVPKKLNNKQKQLLEELQKEETTKSKSWFS